MKQYKITFKLDTPASFTDLPTFDGLLAYCYAREMTKGKSFIQKLSYSKDELIDFSEMPIKLNKNGYFEASSMYFDESKSVEFIERWRKRWANHHDEIADFGKRIRKVAINKGGFKSYDMPLQLKDIEEVWFFFKSNNLENVKHLLKHLYGIGKKIAQGHGLIESYKIEDSFDKFKRQIPVKFIKDNTSSQIQYCAYKPPYWMVSNYEVCCFH